MRHYPGVSVQEIKSRADAAGIALDDSGVQQRPLLVVMPIEVAPGHGRGPHGLQCAAALHQQRGG